MQIRIETKNLNLTDSLNSLINERLNGLKKIIASLSQEALSISKGKTLSEVFVEVERETMHHRKGDIFRAEAIIHLPGKKLVARSHGENVNKVVTAMRDELKREIRKYKAKTIDLPRRKYRKVKKDIL